MRLDQPAVGNGEIKLGEVAAIQAADEIGRTQLDCVTDPQHRRTHFRCRLLEEYLAAAVDGDANAAVLAA